MTLRGLASCLARVAAILCAAEARAQTAPLQNPSRPEPPANLSRPDACELMPKSDLEALFPGRPVRSRGSTLSPADQGPQYLNSCSYFLELPSLEVKGDVPHFASVRIVQWGVHPDAKNGSVERFALMSGTRRKLAADPALGLRFEALPGLGNEAFADVSESTASIHVRQADLIFFVSLDNHLPGMEAIAIALAGRVAGRWRDRKGKVGTGRR